MKKTDTREFWAWMLGQHQSIAVHKPILLWVKDYHATALLEELVWRWLESGRSEFCVTDQELGEKLCMTRRVVQTARGKLMKLGCVKTNSRGVPPKLHYTMLLDVVSSNCTKWCR